MKKEVEAKLVDLIDFGCTDSDLEDFASENNVSEEEVFNFAADYKVKGTPCEGCKYSMMFPGMYPCTQCSRCRKDLYSPKK